MNSRLQNLYMDDANHYHLLTLLLLYGIAELIEYARMLYNTSVTKKKLKVQVLASLCYKHVCREHVYNLS